MKVIDAFSGRIVNKGDVLQHPEGFTYKVLEIQPGILSASITVQSSIGGVMNVPLQVRWTHPRYFLEHVAFIPT